MTRIIVKELVWDKVNLEHIKKHNVSKEEAEEAKNFILHWKTHTNRYLVVSRVGSRLISMVLNRKSTGIYYPVTARDSGKNERRRVYAKEKKQNS